MILGLLQELVLDPIQGLNPVLISILVGCGVLVLLDGKECGTGYDFTHTVGAWSWTGLEGSVLGWPLAWEAVIG